MFKNILVNFCDGNMIAIMRSHFYDRIYKLASICIDDSIAESRRSFDFVAKKKLFKLKGM